MDTEVSILHASQGATQFGTNSRQRSSPASPNMNSHHVNGDAHHSPAHALSAGGSPALLRRLSSKRRTGYQRPVSSPVKQRSMMSLPDKLLQHVLSFIRHKEFPKLALVCKKWRRLVYDSQLWRTVSLRPEHGGLHVTCPDHLDDLITQRFSAGLRSIELSSDLITAPVLQELATKCPNLKHVTLDFSHAMQLQDFNDLQAFPSNLTSLTICLSEVIFLEGFMRRVYGCMSSIKTLHLIGTFEASNDAEDENYEVINISKVRTHTPNLTVINLYGIGFLDDSHVEALAAGCIHLECVALNFCLKVKGASLKSLVARSKKLHCLLLEHCGLQDEHFFAVLWENSHLRELDITCTELSTDCLIDSLCRMQPLEYLAVAHCEFFSDKVLETMEQHGKLGSLQAVDFNFTDKLTEAAVTQFLMLHGHQLKGFLLAGKPRVGENFWLSAIPMLKNIRIFVGGTSQGWFLRMNTKIHVDQLVISMSQKMPHLERMELQWDPETLRLSENSSKFIDHLRHRCTNLRSICLSDGEYYEIVKSNFERADRPTVVRSLTSYTTSIVSLLKYYRKLLFN